MQQNFYQTFFLNWIKNISYFQPNKAILSVTDASILNPCSNRTTHVYSMSKELKKKAFFLRLKNIIAATTIGIPLTSTFPSQKGAFISQIWPVFQPLMRLFWPPVLMELCIRMPQIRNWERDLSLLDKILTKNILTYAFNLSLQRSFFHPKITFFQKLMRLFWPPIRMGLSIHMPQIKK